MGSFAKALGRAAAMSLETESANILRSSDANKRALSAALDGTLRQGHDMRAFGLGTAATLASRARYRRFTAAMHGVYSAMEHELDGATSEPVRGVWAAHGARLRRAPALAADLRDVGVAPGSGGAASAPPSPAAARYVARVHHAGGLDRADGGARLLGHLYCRYFADLFGGQMLAAPTRAALALPVAPRHYAFEFPGGSRRAYIESLYASLNEAGDALPSDAARDAVVDEALRAFGHNVEVYTEEPVGLDAALGAGRVVAGFALSAVGARSRS